MSERGKYIVIEGPDCSGKTTQVEALAGKLAVRGIHTETNIREPGGTAIGEEIRNVLLNVDLARTALTDVLLFNAARVETLARIDSELDKGHWVIASRSYTSTYAYQVRGSGVDPEAFASVTRPVVEGHEPDLELILMISEDEQRKRLVHRGDPDYFESKDADFHRRVRDGYLERARGYNFLVDGEGDAEMINDIIFQYVDGRLLSGTPTLDVLRSRSNEVVNKYPIEA